MTAVWQPPLAFGTLLIIYQNMSGQSLSAIPSQLVAKTINAMLDDFLTAPELPWRILAEGKLAQQLAVSRSTIRSALDYLRDLGILQSEGRQTNLIKKPLKKHYLKVDEELTSKTDDFEAFFFEKISKSELQPGQFISERELSLESGINTVQVREVLATFARYGIITKEPRHRWRVVQFDEHMIDELFDMREMIEERGIRSLAKQQLDTRLEKDIRDLLKEHQQLKKKKNRVVQDFWDLDNRFHRFILDACQNRYLQDMFTSIAMLIHFQLQHDATGQYGMNVGINQHIAVLKALLAGNKQEAIKAMLLHVNTARRVMKATAGIPGYSLGQ